MTKESANKLLSFYGSNPYGESIFRIVWSDDEYEVRKGTFEEQTKESKIYLRTVVAIERVKKYPYLKRMWIFEKWFASPKIDELPESINGIYECIYAFKSKDGTPLPLDEEVITFIASSLSKTAERLKNKQILEDTILNVERKLDEREEDILDDASSLMATQLHIGEAVSLTSTNKKEK